MMSLVLFALATCFIRIQGNPVPDFFADDCPEGSGDCTPMPPPPSGCDSEGLRRISFKMMSLVLFALATCFIRIQGNPVPDVFADCPEGSGGSGGSGDCTPMPPPATPPPATPPPATPPPATPPPATPPPATPPPATPPPATPPPGSPPPATPPPGSPPTTTTIRLR
ncbi:hypothetical protein OS493_003781 [Desmophyllum pertusum]|uniref:Uncharacterized protein n=1 Tax=Desmophyllum pertusum TaxID=174260 RepID=A0A9X0A9P0_9CNID|nr:hypothetical protein OS493_003781 [Desmophyllum pertusum]